jgi:hypothetical protein
MFTPSTPTDVIFRGSKYSSESRILKRSEPRPFATHVERTNFAADTHGFANRQPARTHWTIYRTFISGLFCKDCVNSQFCGQNHRPKSVSIQMLLFQHTHIYSLTSTRISTCVTSLSLQYSPPLTTLFLMSPLFVIYFFSSFPSILFNSHPLLLFFIISSSLPALFLSCFSPRNLFQYSLFPSWSVL